MVIFHGYIDIFSYGFTTGHIAAKELGIAASTTAKESGALNASSKAKKVAQSRSQVPGSSDTVGNGQFTNKIGIYIYIILYIGDFLNWWIFKIAGCEDNLG